MKTWVFLALLIPTFALAAPPRAERNDPCEPIDEPSINTASCAQCLGLGAAAQRGQQREQAAVVRLVDEVATPQIVGRRRLLLQRPDGLHDSRLEGALDRHHLARRGHLRAQPAIAGRDVLELPCELLVPAALERQITADNAPLLDCRIVVEAANGPTTPEAEAILADRGILIIPDVLANAGGVAVSFFEWLQNKRDEPWEEEHVFISLQEKMEAAAAKVAEVASERKCTLREAAYAIALERLSQ